MPNYLTELSPDNNSHVYQIKDKEAAPIDLLKDTVGWVGKNKLKITSETAIVHGVTFTVYKDANGNVLKVRANGTNDGLDHSNFSLRNNDTTRASAEVLGFENNKLYKFSGCVGGSDSTYFLMFNSSGSNKFVCTDGEVEDMFASSDTYYPCIRVVAGQTVNNIDFYPMLRDASITDSTYEPYHPSVEQTLRDAEVIEGKNKFDTSKARFKSAGLTCVTNANGSISIGAGTTTEEFNYPNNASYNDTYMLEPSTEYVFSIGSAITNLRLRVFYKATSSSDWTQLVSEGSVASIRFTTPSSFYVIWVRIDANQGITFPNMTLYPMICTSEEWNKSHDFEPYYIPLKDSKMSWEANAKIGAHNLMPILAKTSRTVQGVNYSYSNDTVSLSGTTSGTGWVWLNNDTNADASNIPFKKGTYRVKVIGTLVDEAYVIRIFDANNNRLYSSDSDGSEHEFTIASDINIRYGIYFKAASKVATSSFKIMICLAEDTCEEHTPFAMTNRELTEVATVQDITSQITTPEQTHYTVSSIKVVRQGNVVNVMMGITSVDITSHPAGTSFNTVKANLPKSFDDTAIITVDRGDGSSRQVQVRVDVNGNLQVRGGTANSGYNVNYMYICK